MLFILFLLFSSPLSKEAPSCDVKSLDEPLAYLDGDYIIAGIFNIGKLRVETVDKGHEAGNLEAAVDAGGGTGTASRLVRSVEDQHADNHDNQHADNHEEDGDHEAAVIIEPEETVEVCFRDEIDNWNIQKAVTFKITMLKERARLRFVWLIYTFKL